MQLTYFDDDLGEPGGEDWQPQADDAHTLRFGYNLADLDRLTRVSLSRMWARNVDRALRYDITWTAIAEALYSAEVPPGPGDLVRAGWEAISDYLHTERRHWGIRHDGSTRPSFGVYWDFAAGHTGSPEPGIVERTALWQIWDRLREEEREALLALATWGEYRPAAGALGLQYNTFCARVRRGRVHFLRLWHEGEAPSGLWGSDRRGSHIQRSGNDSVMGVLRRRARDARKAAA